MTTKTIDGRAKAKNDFLKAIARDVPNPTAYAMHLEVSAPEIAEALIHAQPGTLAATRGHLVADQRCIELLRPFGLIYIDDLCLSIFGMRVRRALIEGRDI